MAAAAHVYTKAQTSLANKLVNLTSDSLKVMLLSAYTPAMDTHQYVSDVLAAGTEVAGSGYTAGGQVLASVTLTQSAHVITLTCANPTWNPSTITASYAVFYDSSPGTNATNPVLVYWDFGGSNTSTAGPFVLQINASGLLNFTAA